MMEKITAPYAGRCATCGETFDEGTRIMIEDKMRTTHHMGCVTPEVGMPATYTVWTDSHACTVIEVRRNGKELVLQCDKATPTHQITNFGDPVHYKYERDPKGRTYVVTLRTKQDGTKVWKTKGQKTTEPGGYANLGYREEYRDPCF